MITIHKDNKPIYNISFHTDFSELGNILSELKMKEHKICIVTDSNVGKYYVGDVLDIAKDYCVQVETFTFSAGESNKNLETVNLLYEKLIEEKFDRSDLLIALGGGVVGDLTGYAAATYLRGIRFIQVPTSLLAMVDSSIGGKTGVDYKSYKNMIGAFYQPKAVYMNFSLLETLSNVQFYSGFGEIIKHGLIHDLSYFQKVSQTDSADLKKKPEIIAPIVKHSCEIKQFVVEQDPEEKGLRAILNFGHTIGHAIEKKLSEYHLHGECVSVGMVAASYISMKRGNITEEEFNTICECLKTFHLPIDVYQYHLDVTEIYNITRNDKKMCADKIKFILLRKMGEAYIDTSVTKDEMMEAIKYVAGAK